MLTNEFLFRRRKLAKDPNNTRWSRDENRFGQRILRDQGWQAGQYLGARDAPYASFHTEANASHIRVFFREDNSGIGHKRDVQDECTGLDAFQHILGRLNGNIMDKTGEDEGAGEDYKKILYTEGQYGGIKFVRGGFLVQDTIESAKDESENGNLNPEVHISTDFQTKTAVECKTGLTKTSRKHKKEEKEQRETEKKERKEKKNERKEKKEKKCKASEDDPNFDRLARKKELWKAEEENTESTDIKASLSSGDQSLISSSWKISKKKKMKSEPALADRGKQDKKSKRDKKSKKWKQSDNQTSLDRMKSDKDKRKRNAKSTNDAQDSEELSSALESRETPVHLPPPVLGTASHPPVEARRLHRSRFIAQKRAAVMDKAALNQVFPSTQRLFSDIF